MSATPESTEQNGENGRVRKAAVEAGEQKPAPAPVQPEQIPAALQSLPQWVCWRWEKRKGKWTKPPVNPRTGRLAKTNDPTTWASFPEALALYQRGRADGVGLVLAPPLVGVDLDDCRNVATEEIDPCAVEVLQKLQSYSEISPSGTGVKVLVEGERHEFMILFKYGQDEESLHIIGIGHTVLD